MKVNVFEVKAKFSEYLDRVASGERIVICRHNKPVAEFRPVEAARTEERPIGPLPGRPTFDVPAAFFEPLEDSDLRLWEGTGDVPTAQLTTGPARGTSRVAEVRGGTPRKRAARNPRKRS